MYRSWEMMLLEQLLSNAQGKWSKGMPPSRRTYKIDWTDPGFKPVGDRRQRRMAKRTGIPLSQYKKDVAALTKR